MPLTMTSSAASRYPVWMPVLILSALTLLLSACGGDAPAPTSEPEAQAQAVTQAESAPPTATPLTADVVAEVNGQPISRGRFEAALERRMMNTDAADTAALRDQVLDTLIEQELIAQAAAEWGISVSDAEVEAEIAALRNSVQGEEAWQDFLTMNGYNADEFFEAQRESLLTQRVRDIVLGDMARPMLQARARHILVRTEAEANAIRQQLAEGVPFQDLAARHSLDATTREQGGDLGWFTEHELMDARLADVIFAQEVGDIAGPIATRIGYHVVQTLAIEERPVERERLPMLQSNLYYNWLEAQWQQATIERYL